MLMTLLILLHLLPLDKPEGKGKTVIRASICVGGTCHVPRSGR